MTLYDFHVLDIDKKMEVVNQIGVYLDNYITKELKYNIYAIDKFFVEVTYDPIKNKISKIKSFKSGHLLDKYSNIESLLDNL